MDWASRHRRRKARDIEHAIHKAEQKLQHAPSEEQIATEMGMTLDDYHARLVEIQGLNLESLDMTTSPSSNKTLMSLLADPEENLPSNLLERSELERLLAKCIGEMPDKEKTVISLYYLEELTLREIAEVMDLHISRVAHLKSTALLRLRSQMKAQWNNVR
jgi:RNA polymerase sigma factor for flagellar operon FliA